MSELTTEQVLAMIQEAAQRREPVDLRGRDLRRIDLSLETVGQYAERYPKAISGFPGGVNVNLREAHLEGADLSDSALRGVRFYRVDLDRTRFSRAELGRRVEKKGDEEVIVQDKPLVGEEARGDWANAKEAYLALKQNFQFLGRYEDARWAYVKERQMERKSFFPSQRGDTWVRQKLDNLPSWVGRHLPTFSKWALYLRLLLWPRAPQNVHLDRPKWLLNLAFEGLAGYGEHLWKPLVGGLGILVVWSFLFAWVGVEGALDWTDYLIFSLRSFATMAFNDLQPANLAAKLLSAVEAMLGVSTLALVMYCLGRRMSGS